MIIAIDGPSGAGKGTVAKKLAKKLNFTYIDTGAMYRCIALKTLRENIDISDTDKIVNIAKKVDIRLTNDGMCYLDEEDVSNEIRTMKVTQRVSKISLITPLREVMRELQRAYAKKDNIVMEGRDITTAVFKDADYKFYLDASIEVRAERRYKENIEKQIECTYETIKQSIMDRDYDDEHRVDGKLMRTEEQIYINSDNMTIDEVVNYMLEKIEVK